MNGLRFSWGMGEGRQASSVHFIGYQVPLSAGRRREIAHCGRD